MAQFNVKRANASEDSVNYNHTIFELKSASHYVDWVEVMRYYLAGIGVWKAYVLGYILKPPKSEYLAKPLSINEMKEYDTSIDQKTKYLRKSQAELEKMLIYAEKTFDRYTVYERG